MITKRIIRDRNELPDWFTIEKYHGAKGLTLVDWTILLTLRWTLDQSIDFQAEKARSATKDHSTTAPDFDPSLHRFMQKIGRAPLEHKEITKLLPQSDFWASKAVRPTPSIGLGQPGFNDPAKIEIDLAASDTQIIDDFGHWLKYRRARSAVDRPAKNFTAKDALTWHQDGVLPYIDLTLWARLKNVQIAQHTLGAAIFLNVYSGDPTEKIRRTTKKKAEQLLTKHTIGVLRRQNESALLSTSFSAYFPT